jgi:hypothetical protein
MEKPLSTYLVREALRAGIPHASVNLGQIGYTANAKNISIDHGEIPLTTLAVRAELLAPKRVLEAVDEAVQHGPHSVEYITGVDVSVKVDHVRIDEAADGAVS